MAVQEFINTIVPYIQKYASQYNIQVISAPLAQAILESAAGESELARNAQNYFGLKFRTGRCPTAYTTPYIKEGAEQNPDGSYSPSVMQWMQFPNMDAGVHGYFDFINISTYANLKGVTDPFVYLTNIKNDGYATSINYVTNLMSIITKYNLTQYDKKEADMGFTNSPLVSYTKLSPNYNPRSNRNITKITKITIHHMAGNLSVESCGNIFANKSHQASSNYGIGSDGRVALYVEEKNRAWTSGNADNDYVAVTIEVADWMSGEPWMISDAAYISLINLCVDICQRNGITAVNYDGTKNAVLTEHRMFQATSCPGTTLHNCLVSGQIVNDINSRLAAVPTPIPAPTPTPSTYPAVPFTVNVSHTITIYNAPNGTPKTTCAKGTYTIIDVSGDYGKLKSGSGWICLTDPNVKVNGTPAPAPTPTPVSKYPTPPFLVQVLIDQLNIRKGPGTNYPVVQTTGKATYTITKVDGDWGLLKSNVGWIYLANPTYVKIEGTTTKTATVAATPKKTKKVVHFAIKMRKTASWLGKTLCTVPLGATVEILDESNKTWTKVSFAGYTGYVPAQHLQ